MTKTPSKQGEDGEGRRIDAALAAAIPENPAEDRGSRSGGDRGGDRRGGDIRAAETRAHDEEVRGFDTARFDAYFAENRGFSDIQLLQAPKPPPGYSFRWCAFGTMGEDQTARIKAKQQRGWLPVRKSEIRGYMLPTGHLPGEGDDYIIQGQQVLCITPSALVEKRKQEQARRSDVLQAGIDRDFHADESVHGSLEIDDRREETDTGQPNAQQRAALRGREVDFAADQ